MKKRNKVEHLATKKRLSELLARREKLQAKLTPARKRFYEAKAQVNHLEFQMGTLQDQINLIQQGQLYMDVGTA